MDKITFKNGETPAINDVNLNQMQDNIENAINEAEEKIEELKTKPIREKLFNNLENTSLEITLDKSVYEYSYLYVESNAATYNAIIPIFSDVQTSFRGIGGFLGEENVGTTHTQGSISNKGKTITFSYFTSIVHNSSGNHTASADRAVCKIIGVR